MIAKKKSSEINKGRLRVTFSMPAIDGCHCLYLVGKFDEWDQSVYRMQQAEDGTWSLALELEPGCEYEYCYSTDNGVWHNHPAADMIVLKSDDPEQSNMRLRSVSSFSG